MDNGDPRPEENKVKEAPKTEEQLKAERLKRYQDNPDKFIEFKEIAVMSIFNPKSLCGISIMINPNTRRSQLNNTQAEMNGEINKFRIQKQLQGEMMASGSKILKSGDKVPFYKRIAGKK